MKFNLTFFLFFIIFIIGNCQTVPEEIYIQDSKSNFDIKPEVKNAIFDSIASEVDKKFDNFRIENNSVSTEDLSFVKDTLLINSFVKEFRSKYKSARDIGWSTFWQIGEYQKLIDKSMQTLSTILQPEPFARLKHTQKLWRDYVNENNTMVYEFNYSSNVKTVNTASALIIHAVFDRLIYLRGLITGKYLKNKSVKIAK